MFNYNNGYSLADIAAVTDKEHDGYDGWGNNGAWWIIILFLFMFMGWGNRGFNGDAATQGALTRADLCQDMNFSQLENGVRGVQQGLCDGFYAMNTGLLNGFNGVQRDLCTGFSAVNSGIAENRFAQQNCCCETNRNIDAVRYENAKNTCEITTNANMNTRDIIEAQNAGFQRIADMMQQNKIESLRSELEGARYQISNMAQTQALVDQLRPCPVPAYLTCSPYAAYPFGNSGYGCGCNCG